MGKDVENPYIAKKKSIKYLGLFLPPCFYTAFFQDKKRFFVAEGLWNRTKALYAFEPT